jgi:conjugal transfer/entry exclusion protein
MTVKNYFARMSAVALAVALIAAPAHALVFTDPINLIQNTFSARAGIQNEINSARALIQQINSAKELARSTASLKNLSRLAGVDKARMLYSELVELDSRLDSNLERNGSMTQDLRAQYGASNMSWDQFADAQSRLDTDQKKATRDRYASITRSMEETSRRREEIVSQLGQVQGQTEAMQALGTALDVIIGQNQQIIAAMVTNSKQEEAKRSPDQNQQQWAENQRALYQKRLREAASQF